MGKKKLLKKLRAAANQLPTANRLVKVVIDGKSILEKNPSATSKDGIAIDEKGRYLVDAPQKVNHYRAMKKAANKHGVVGAGMYYSAVKQLEEKHKKDNGKTE